MPRTKKGWANKFMIGAHKKEASYGAGVTMNASNACSSKGFAAEVSFPDVLANDKDEVTGTEHGTEQQIIEKRVQIEYSEQHLKPNTLAWAGGLAFGDIASTQDGALTAYRHGREYNNDAENIFL